MRAGTPVYAEYKLRPLIEEGEGGGEPTKAAVVAAAKTARKAGEAGAPDPRLAEEVFREAKEGTTRYTLSLDEAAGALWRPREEIVRAVGDLEALGLVEVRAPVLGSRPPTRAAACFGREGPPGRSTIADRGIRSAGCFPSRYGGVRSPATVQSER